MDSIKTILNSEKFQREAPNPMKLLIRKIQRENSKTEVTAFSPLFPVDTTDRKNREPNRKQKENAA